MPRELAAGYLGVSVVTFDQMTRDGHIAKFEARWTGTGHNRLDMFDRAELDRFLDSIPLERDHAADLRRGRRPLGLFYMPSLPRVLTNTVFDGGEFFTEVMAGRLVVDCRLNRTGGLRSFLLAPEWQPWDHPFTARCLSLQITRTQPRYEGGMSLRQVCAALEVSPDTVEWLHERDHIRRLDTGEGTWRNSFDRTSVEAFAARYLVGKLYAGALDCASRWVTRAAAEHGLKPLIPVAHRYTSLYDRKQMRKVLRLAHDPDHGDVARPAWKKMADRLAEAKSPFSLVLIRDAVSASFVTNDAQWPITVTYVFDPEASRRGLQAEQVYTIEAVFEIAGRKAAKRIDAFKEVVKVRDLHPLVTTYASGTDGVCRATIRTHVFNEVALADTLEETVAEHVCDDAPTINWMLNVLKASLEEGPREHDPRMFGGFSGFRYREAAGDASSTERKRVA